MKKLLSILGSTGSVGLNTLELIDKKKNYFKPFIFSANKNYNQISNQIIKYKPNFFVVNDKQVFRKLSKKFKNRNTKILNSFDHVYSKSKSSLTISAIPGIAGLSPILKITNFSDKILIANKEAVICGWDLIKKKAKLNKTKLIPIDSEHFSIMKLLEDQDKDSIRKIYITASGGPFLNFSLKKLKKVTVKQALNHPKWKMGKKISIDSSTLMNKLFEVIEAQKIFNLPEKKIEILIHPNSLVHAILEQKNGIRKFILHETSMKIPLANAIFDSTIDINNFYKQTKKINFGNLIFKKVNKKIFPLISIMSTMSKYPSAPIIINAANEVIVERFLEKKLPFLDIHRKILAIMRDVNFKKYAIKKPKTIKQIFQIDHWARSLTMKKLKN